MTDKKIIAVDFDGTCVTHKFPEIGEDSPDAVDVLKDLVRNGHKLILFTMRSDRENMGGKLTPEIKDVTGTFLTDAVNWFKERDIPLWGIQTNPEQKEWTTSPKAYAHIYIDDAALGCPLRLGKEGKSLVADWSVIKSLLIYQGLLP